MHLERLLVDGVRNLVSVQLEPHRHLNVFVGRNGQGKTNLLEAIHLAAALRPLRALDRAADLVAFGGERGVVRALFDVEGPLPIEMVVEPRGRKATLAGKAVRDVGEVASRIGVVSFVPEDAAVVRGSPEVRRRALDRFAFGLVPSFAHVARRYEEALERRNRLLKAPFVDGVQLEAYTAPLVDAGVELTLARGKALASWAPRFASEARAIGGDALAAELRYVCALTRVDDAEVHVPGELEALRLRELFERALAATAQRERQRKSTLVGPHLDDMAILKADRRARNLASQGEARALVLALKLAQVRLYTEARGTGPLLLLDDVAGELDPDKQGRLLRAVDECQAQAFVTATHLELLPKLAGALVVDVEGGRATPRVG